MSLIKCPDCDNDISSLASACPKCGCPAQLFAPPPSISVMSKSERDRLLQVVLTHDPKSLQKISKISGKTIVKGIVKGMLVYCVGLFTLVMIDKVSGGWLQEHEWWLWTFMILIAIGIVVALFKPLVAVDDQILEREANRILAEKEQ